MGKIHKLKIIPGSKAETKFIEALEKVGVKLESVMCRQGRVFGTKYDEYIISNGLYKQISDPLENVRRLD